MLEKADCPLLGRRLWGGSLVIPPRISSQTLSAAGIAYLIPTVGQDVSGVLGLDRKHVFLPYMLYLMMLAKCWEKCSPHLPTSSVANPSHQKVTVAFGGQHNMRKYAWHHFDFPQLPYSLWLLLLGPSSAYLTCQTVEPVLALFMHIPVLFIANLHSHIGKEKSIRSLAAHPCCESCPASSTRLFSSLPRTLRNTYTEWFSLVQ